MGGDEIIAKAYEHGWLAEDVTEEEILEAQRVFAQAGFFVEPATATTLSARPQARRGRPHEPAIGRPHADRRRPQGP